MTGINPVVDDDDLITDTDIQRSLDILDARSSHIAAIRQHISRMRNSSEDRDQKMAKSMAAAVIADGPLIIQHKQEEHVATHDRHLIKEVNVLQQRLKSLKARPAEVDRQVQALVDQHSAPALEQPSAVEMAYLAKLAGLFISRAAGEALMPHDLLAAEFAASGRQTLGVSHTCESCGDKKTWFDVFIAPCGDKYCKDCILELFNRAMKDQSLFPPSCCRQVMPIESKELRLYLDRNLVKAYPLRKLELETVDKTYCIRCQTFIVPSTITGAKAVCPKCKLVTCARCKKGAHVGLCKEDEATKSFLALAKKKEWQACKCGQMVELTYGCNHMKCVCGKMFCYKCGEKWKTCTCVRFDPDRLLRRTEQVLDRDGVVRETPIQRQLRVQRLAQVIRDRHNCSHPRDRWNRVNGQHQCEECHDTLREFILECGQCRLRACVRCRNNRYLV